MFFCFHDDIYDRPIFVSPTDVVAVCPFRGDEECGLLPRIQIILRTGVTDITIFGSSYEDLLEQMNSFGTLSNNFDANQKSA